MNIERRRWGVGSDHFQHERNRQSHLEAFGAPKTGEPTRTGRGTTGRVTWDRSQIPFELIGQSTTERELFRFEKTLTEFIWNTAALEGNTYTLPEVRTLLDGVTIGGHRVSDANQIIAFSEGLNTMTERVAKETFDLSRQTSNEIHGLIARHEAIEAGGFRGEGSTNGGGVVSLATGGSVIGDPIGEDRLQLDRDYSNLEGALRMIEDPRERALAYFASATRSQFYFDGNKRTARLMMAGELMKHGFEGIGIPYLRQLEFNEALDTLFRTNDATELMAFIATCATGGTE